jgi:hypothetical protein
LIAFDRLEMLKGTVQKKNEQKLFVEESMKPDFRMACKDERDRWTDVEYVSCTVV